MNENEEKKFNKQSDPQEGKNAPGAGEKRTKGHAAGKYNPDRKRGEHQDSFSKKRPCAHFNSPEYYKPNEALAKDVSNVSFGNILGQTMPTLITLASEGGTNIPIAASRIPGVAALRFAPYYGVTNTEAIAASEAPVNVAAQKIYATVRSKNSGAKNYDPVDIMQIVIACDSLLMWYAELCRVYGVLMNYDTYSRYTPQCIVEALGFNYTSLKQNMLELRVLINSLAAQIDVFAIPADLAVIHRHYEMCRYVFAESDEPRAQLYCNVPEFQYRWSNVDGNVSLVADNVKGNVLIDIARARLFTKNLIDPIFYNEDVALIMGDMRKADIQFMSVNPIPEDYRVTPVYGEDALRQMRCSLPVGISGDNRNWVYSQQLGKLVTSSTFGAVSKTWCDYLTNIRTRFLYAKKALTNDEVLVSSRFQPLVKVTGSRVNQDHDMEYNLEITSAGSEIPLLWKLYLATGSGTFTSVSYHGSVLYLNYDTDTQWVGYPAYTVKTIESMAAQFKWITPLVRVHVLGDVKTPEEVMGGLPVMTPFMPDPASASYYSADFAAPVDGLATYTNADQPGGGLAAIHEVALLGEFNIKSGSGKS